MNVTLKADQTIKLTANIEFEGENGKLQFSLEKSTQDGDFQEVKSAVSMDYEAPTTIPLIYQETVD